MRAVIIGPGRIGCGFAAQLLRRSGYEVTLVGRNPLLVDHLNRLRRFWIRLVEGCREQVVLVAGVAAVCTLDRERVVDAIAGANLVVTAVRPENVPEVAVLVAEGLERRTAPVNVLAFENLENAGAHLRELVAAALPVPAAAAMHGFSSVLVDRIVSERQGELWGDEPLTFVGDPPEEFIVHGPSLRPPLPEVDGMIVADDFRACFLRKLYTFSAGHAITAYLGHLKGYRYVHAAIQDPEIRALVLAAMREGQRGLAVRYGSDFAGTERDLRRIVARFENAALNDPVERVGRDPKRKLSPEDRLVGAARLAAEAGIRPEGLAKGVAAGLCFFSPRDRSAVDLHREIEVRGPKAALWSVSGLDRQGVGRMVLKHYLRLARGMSNGDQRAVLVSLNRLMWASRADIPSHRMARFVSRGPGGRPQELGTGSVP